MQRDIAEKLRAPFKSDQIGKLPKVTCSLCSDRGKQCGEHKRQKCRVCKAYISTAHMHVDFVGHADVTDRLLQVDPDWNWEPLAFGPGGLPSLDDNGGMWIRLTIGGTSRIGYGHADGKKGGNAVKECIGDAIRNAAMRFGVALDLWRKEPPAPVEDVPTRQVERPAQTEDERKTELRGQIALVAKAQGKAIEAVADDFAAWSQGQDIRSASVVVLVEYLNHIQRKDAA